MKIIKTSKCGTLRIQDFNGPFSIEFLTNGSWVSIGDGETLQQAKQIFKSFGGK